MEPFSSSHNTAGSQSVPEISPNELVKILESRIPVQIVDMRARGNDASWKAGFLPDESILNIVGSHLVQVTSAEQAGLDHARPVVVLCAHGNDSKIGAAHLNRLGMQARSLTGGMAAWMMTSVPRIVPSPRTIDLLVQFDRIGKESLSYVLISDREAILIDPPRDVHPHLQCIEEAGAKVVAVADTHVHADFLSGAQRIGRELMVPYYLHPADGVFPYDGRPGRLETSNVSDGMNIRVGECRLIARHTPGHSPGSVTYMVGEEAAFTGDFIFVASIGRPDLADKTEEWSASLWRSLQSAKNSWSADMMVYPAHYSSRTARGAGGVIGGRFGDLVRTNPGLQMADEKDFLRWITESVTSAPSAYRTIKGANIGLFTVDEREAEVLENGKNECAVGFP